MKRFQQQQQADIWHRELKRPPDEAVKAASIRLKETCEHPSGFSDLLMSDACQCPHLTKWLPNMLDVNHIFCKNINGPRSAPLILANPIHALHMSSQLEENSTVSEQNYRNMGTSPWLYGEEQQRTVALSQAGIPSSFFPITTKHIFHQFNPPNPDAPKPLHADPALWPAFKKESQTGQIFTSTSLEPSPKKVKLSSSTPASPLERRPSVSFASPLEMMKTAKDTDRPIDEDKLNPKAQSRFTDGATAKNEGKANDGNNRNDSIVNMIDAGGESKGEAVKDEEKRKMNDQGRHSTDAEMEVEANEPQKQRNSGAITNDAGEEPKSEAMEKHQAKEKNDKRRESVCTGLVEDMGLEKRGVADVEKTDSNEKYDQRWDSREFKEEGSDVDWKGESIQDPRTDRVNDDGKEKSKDDSSKDFKGDEHFKIGSPIEGSKSGASTEYKNQDDLNVANSIEGSEASIWKGLKKGDDPKTGGSIESSEDRNNNEKGVEGVKRYDEVTTTDDAKKAAKNEEIVKTSKGIERDKGAKLPLKPGSPGRMKNEAVDSPASLKQWESKTSKATDAEKHAKQALEPGGAGSKANEAADTLASPMDDSGKTGNASVSLAPSTTLPKTTEAGSASTTPVFLMSDARYGEISRQEDQIKVIRNLLAKRHGNTKKKSKKRKLETHFSGSPHSALQSLPGSLHYTDERAVIDMDKADIDNWFQQKFIAKVKVELWLEQFRSSRRTFWNEQAKIQEQSSKNEKPKSSIKFSEWSTVECLQRTCQLCPKSKRSMVGDEVMQCLECSFVGCSPASIAPESRHHHILQHLFLSGHKFAVTCGARADVWCFPCGDFVFHRLFDQERERLDLETKIPWLAWKDHPLQRSFDPLQFAQVEEYGIIWRGLLATYPPLVPQEHVDASKLCLLRQALFEGRVLERDWFLDGRRALDFFIDQNKTAPEERWSIPAPIGMYNLGNTCFMSSILQCLVHCTPLQRYFLKDIGHHHKACKMYRHLEPENKSRDAADNVCLACEMDSLMLQCFSRTTGRDVISMLEDISAAPRRNVMDLFSEITSKDEEDIEKGEPIIPSRMLHVAWKSGGMGHLAGYEQRDAHEFLHAFLDILGKQICKHRARVDAAIALAQAGSRFRREQDQVHHDVIKHLFEGTLRSVLVCEECGSKRTLSEAFLNVSLPLLKESMAVQGTGTATLSLDRCLEHFTTPEKLTDPVDCPACKRKTPTKKQHTFSKLPKVLCVHLKRFHAALNKKIEDFVAFPAWGLNMGPHLPHWREVTLVPDEGPQEGSQCDVPQILYDLFGTVNHHGNLSSGHYVTNIKVKGGWFRCNDQHVSSTDEATVLASEGAYILFYIRR